MAEKNPTVGIKLPLTIKPDLFTYFLGGALSFIFCLPLIVTIARGRWDWGLFAFSFGLTTALFLLIHGCRIIAGKNGLTYTRLFVWSCFLPYEQMNELKIETSVFRSRNPKGRGKPVYSLVIQPHNSTLSPLIINIKLFSRKGLSTLMQILSAQAPAAHFDKRCEQMKQRFMPSLLGDEKEMRSRSKIVNFLLKER